MNKTEIWFEFALAFVKRGESPNKAAELADIMVEKYLKREPPQPFLAGTPKADN